MLKLKNVFRLVLGLCALLIASLSIQAQQELQQVEIIMPFEAARAAGLGTEINQAQKISFVNVNVQWAYADVNGVIVVYTTDAGKLRTSDGRSVQSVRLTDDNGLEFFLGGRSIYGAMETVSGLITFRTAEFQFPPGFKSTDLPETLDLSFEVNTEGYPLTAEANGTTATLAPESTQEVIPPLPKDIFRFEFSVPVYRAIEKRVDAVQTVNDVTVTLKSVRITPILTTVEVCTLQPKNIFWETRGLHINVDGNTAVSPMLYLRYLSQDCQPFGIPIFAGLQPQSLHYELGALVENPIYDDLFDWVGIQPELAEYGVKVSLDGQGHFRSASAENSEDLTDALVELGYTERIDGPWTFEVDLAEAAP